MNVNIIKCNKGSSTFVLIVEESFTVCGDRCDLYITVRCLISLNNLAVCDSYMHPFIGDSEHPQL